MAVLGFCIALLTVQIVIKADRPPPPPLNRNGRILDMATPNCGCKRLVKPGDTCEKLAAQYDVIGGVSGIIHWNEGIADHCSGLDQFAYVCVGVDDCEPPKCGCHYKIQQGDRCLLVAAKFGHTASEALWELNPGLQCYGAMRPVGGDLCVSQKPCPGQPGALPPILIG